MTLLYTIAGTYRAAGMERILTDKANALAKHGINVYIVTTDQAGRPDAFPLYSKVHRIDLPIGYEANNGGSFLDKLVHYPALQRKHRKLLRKVLEEIRPDIVISMFCGDEGFLPRIKDGSRKVLEVHFSRFKRLQYGRRGLWAIADRIRSAMDARHIRAFECFITLTQEDLGYWGHPANGQVIPNFLSSVPAEPSPLTGKTVLAVGRFSYQKGFDRLLDAWAEVKENPLSLSWNLVLAGGGELRQELEDQVLRLGIQSSVTLLDAVKDMDTLYRSASILALSSRYEGLPMVLLEAQAYGLPVVSFDCQCGPRDVITPGKDGLLVPEGDVRGLSDALLSLMAAPEKRKAMGETARRRAARWDKDTIIVQWIKLFTELSSSPR